MRDLDKKKADRFRFLNKVYEIADGGRHHPVNTDEIGNVLGLSQEEAEKITDYLVGEGLIAHHAFGLVVITHYGIIQVEDAISNPEKPTQYFPPINIIQVGQMYQSQIQQASGGGEQSLTITENATTEIRTLLAELKLALGSMSLSQQNQKDLSGEIATIEGQIQTSKPKRSIIKECLSSLRNILEQVGASVLAEKAISIFDRLGA